VGTRSLQQLERNVAAAAARNDAAVDRELDALSAEAMRHIPGDGNIFLYTP
jgi:aryl-alcohol dehydrogenase-like predicted oxidoreductase